MLQVYGRVLSVPTLVILSVMACAAFLLQGALDAVRRECLH
jgi:ABC-type protease/lipase transport system fused ATPase/permease subunit